jgi:hypothetical protein
VPLCRCSGALRLLSNAMLSDVSAALAYSWREPVSDEELVELVVSHGGRTRCDTMPVSLRLRHG